MATSFHLGCYLYHFSSVAQSYPAVCDPMDCNNARLPCLSSTPAACWNSCPSSQWCPPTISSSDVPFSSCLQSFPASGSFSVSQFFASGGQSIGSFSFSISPSSEYSGLISFRIDWFDLAVQRTLKSLLTPQFKGINSSALSFFFMVQLLHPYMTTGKTIALTRRTFVGKVMSLLFSIQSRFVIAFLPRSKHLLISWLQSSSAVILEPPENSLSVFPLLPHLFAMKWWDWMPWS